MLLIEPEWIAPVVPSGTVLKQHSVVVRDERIVDLLPREQARTRYPQAIRTELPGHLLVPGLVNLHTHAAMSLLRGTGDDLALKTWLEDRIWPLEGRLMSPQFVFDGSLLACAEMLLGGITCFNDMYFFPEEVAQAAGALGLRASLGIITLEFPSAYGSGPDEYLRKGLELRDRLRDDPLISFCLAPHAPYTVSDASFSRVARLVGELGLPVHCHVHETLTEVTDAQAASGERPLARLMRLGIVGPELIAVHAVHLDDAEIRMLGEHGASVAHCPHSNLKLGSGIAPTRQMLREGINIGIGTDGSASNNRLDLLAEGRSAALLAKGVSGDASAWPAHAVLESLTISGARALGLAGSIGSIEPGKQADLVAFELAGPELSPVFDPVSQLIYAAGREHLRESWIAGQHVVHKRQLLGDARNAKMAEVVARSRLWQNRIGEILSPG